MSAADGESNTSSRATGRGECPRKRVIVICQIDVRDVEPEDREDWLKLWEGYNAFYERLGPTALPSAVTDMTWARFFDAQEPVHCLVADDGDRVVGLAHYIFHRNTIMLGPTCYLQDVFTSEQARGRGVGRALIGAVYDRARAAGAMRVYWHTHESNATARGLYDKIAERSGFIVYRKDL